MRGSEYAPPRRRDELERCHGLAMIIERRAVVLVRAANNYANSLFDLQRYAEAKSLLRRTGPVARRVLGKNHEATLKMRWLYAISLYHNDRATLDDLREAVETLESVALSWKLVFGEAHPETPYVQGALEDAREALAARAAASSSGAA